jgi:hypothetical protein
MPVTHTVTHYSFSELSDDAKEKAVENMSDCNVDYGWWEGVYEDAKSLGLIITESDVYRSTIDGRLELSLLDSCKIVRKNHGKHCGTFKTAKQYLSEYCTAFVEWLSYQDTEDEEDWTRLDWFKDFEWSEEAEDITKNYRMAMLEEYIVLLRKEYEYLASRDAIIETIMANEYLFDETGNHPSIRRK